ncbi:hypothetical protein PAXRUDRAFT_830840 [Paxillus rubicundulus Ve08.2h10]|uniref:Unplaced genomic scaffold scaffold_563, whole genome shotgun sequence n=1 Tax=Paxillus rubicundulus Ve08.2h10 TaxID=930991 RepID=A0A0D0DSY7_9AGAM|nr:hypothetical protein PAXRUDRAFT_830840 [Paxillus rubicundulus Ve08.2h10]
MSDEPAMHDEKLNTKSFSKRASSSKDRLPSIYSTGQFCHTCQTNQMLLVNLLSNYLPPPRHPDYRKRLEQLPAYRESLHVRYPPVCETCSPAVEDEIQRKNQMARTKALGGWLKESKGKDRQRQVSSTERERERVGYQLAVWRLRGALWWMTLLCVVASHAAAIQEYSFPRMLVRAIPVLPVFSLLSLFYTAWDPTYYRFKKARVQGRDIRVKGKTRYIVLQMIVWLSRFTTSILLVLSWRSSSRDYLRTSTYPASYRIHIYCSISLLVEISVLFSSFAILHLRRPPPIRLIDTSNQSHIHPSSARATPELSSHSVRASPMPSAPASEPDLIASLTLSSKPVISPTNPIFGHPSLLPSTLAPTAPSGSPIKVDGSLDEDAMDWTPTNPSPIKPKKLVDDDNGSWLRPQRFFPPERPTGLETLFANTKLEDVDSRTSNPTTPMWLSPKNLKAIGWWIAALTVILVPLGAIAYRGGLSRRYMDLGSD